MSGLNPNLELIKYTSKHKVTYSIENDYHLFSQTEITVRYEGEFPIQRENVGHINFNPRRYYNDTYSIIDNFTMCCCLCTCGIARALYLYCYAKPTYQALLDKYILPKLLREADQEIDRRIKEYQITNYNYQQMAQKIGGNGIFPMAPTTNTVMPTAPLATNDATSYTPLLQH